MPLEMYCIGFCKNHIMARALAPLNSSFGFWYMRHIEDFSALILLRHVKRFQHHSCTQESPLFFDLYRILWICRPLRTEILNLKLQSDDHLTRESKFTSYFVRLVCYLSLNADGVKQVSWVFTCKNVVIGSYTYKYWGNYILHRKKSKI